MPIIMPHHAWKDRSHRPSDDWPPDCQVQWGGEGIVLSRSAEAPRRTAFFEAFPATGGFIRGEGATIADAERAALRKFRLESVCDHRWARRDYTNGGAICQRCRGFKIAFKPIVRLGGFREPVSATALSLLADGHVRPDADDPARNRRMRRIWLMARRMGIELPEQPPPARPTYVEEDDYALACRRAVRDWLIRSGSMPGRHQGAGIAGLFEGLSRWQLQDLMEED